MQYLHAADIVFFRKRVAARDRVVLAAPADAETFFLLPQGTLLVAANPLQLLFDAHPGPAALRGTQLLLHGAVWALL